MHVVIALDKFKHSIDAPTACRVVNDAIQSIAPDWTTVRKPLADGGDGTAGAMIAARNGEWILARVRDPLGREIEAGYGWFEHDQSAVVEMAAASGIALLTADERNPLRASTYGTGQLIQAATDRGARTIYLGVGGSATVDGGTGAAAALGWQFLDAAGEQVRPGGGNLERIVKLVEPRIANREPRTAVVRVLCDVDNPLCGPTGAAAVFGPQKGATPAMIERLDRGLAHLASLVKDQLGKDIRDVPGAGAAGGLSAGALAFLEAELVPGIDTIMTITGVDEALRDADWVITGEGKFDESSLCGKVVSGVARRARAHGARVAVLAGRVQVEPEIYRAAGIDLAVPFNPSEMPLEEAVRRTPEFLGEGTAKLVEMVRSDDRRS